jgi:hypothetical protein
MWVGDRRIEQDYFPAVVCDDRDEQEEELPDGGHHEMSCVSVVGNRCEETALVSVSADLVMMLCIFQGSAAGCFIGAHEQSSTRLVRCVVDFHVVAEGSVVLATEGCVLGTGSMPFADYRTRTLTPRASDTDGLRSSRTTESG